ncbi:MAG: Mor transcription activator family protein [Acidobacteriota bacterium]
MNNPRNITKEFTRARLPQLAPPTSVREQRDPRTARLPKVPRALAKRLGYEVGLLLMTKFGGSLLSVPTSPTPAKGSVISRALGEAAARVMTELWGGESLEIPLGSKVKAADRRRAIIDHPGSHNEVAREFGVSRRWVRMVRAGNDALQAKEVA